MINLRSIDGKYALGGAWQDVTDDLDILAGYGIKAVLDVQPTPSDFNLGLATEIRLLAEEAGIEYHTLPLYDGPNADFEIRMHGLHRVIQDWEEQYPRSFQRILVKCGDGFSRSKAVLIYHLCRSKQMSFYEAEDYIDLLDVANLSFPKIKMDTFFYSWLSRMFPDAASVSGG